MDLGIKGKWALVGGASKGLGLGCAQALAEAGVNVVMVARGVEALGAAAQAIRQQHGVEVIAVAADITTSEGRSQALAAHPELDILVTNAGGPPPGDFRHWSRDDWLAAIDANMLTPIELIKATVDGMAARGFGRVVNITSGAVKAPIDVLGLSNGARSGLTGFVAGLARQKKLAANNVTINNLLPGWFDTDRIKSVLKGAAEKPAPRWNTRRRPGSSPSLQGALAARQSSARPVPSSAASTRATSPDRTFSSTGAHTPVHSELLNFIRRHT
jgi:3-oxoacyl-[acyl-carrier protein] reductase